MEQETFDRLKAIAAEKGITDAKTLEHYMIFGTTDMDSTIQEEGAPRSEHYMFSDLELVLGAPEFTTTSLEDEDDHNSINYVTN